MWCIPEEKGRIMRKAFCLCFASLILNLAAGASAFAAAKDEAELLIDKARIVIEEMVTSRDKVIPEDLLRDCAGLAIMPGMFKGGFIVGGAYGKGIVLANQDGKWTGPAFSYLGAGSVGFQIGVESVDLILVIIGQKAMDSFLRTSFKLGGDVAVAAGPVGAQASAATDIMLNGGIFSYSRAKGLFAGISLEGAVIGSQHELNESFYGTGNIKSILYGQVEQPASAKRLVVSIGKLKKE
jgi:lipid-binding SYLF domain-containing protein